MSGPTEEAGLTVRAAVGALQSTPVLLGILIFNIAFMVMLGWGSHESGERWERTVAMTIKQCIPAAEQSK